MNMTASEKIRIIAKRVNMSMGELAEATGQTRQNLSNKLSRDNLSQNDLLSLASAMGCTVEIKFTLPDGTEI
ncbi:MAG: helix-turn-helix transcriptional regulator [Firmicutes bacterium]|nr:helix-turn-helix transcriptional regulator [Bacillota bacterium]